MSIIFPEIIEGTQKFQIPADLSKIEKISLTPKQINVKLVRDKDGEVEISLDLVFNYKDNIPDKYHLKTGIYLGNLPDDGAIQEYEQIKEKLQKGEYKLKHYDTGELEFQFK
jgi:hypothetical protein